MSTASWYKPRITEVNPTGRRIKAPVGKCLQLSLELEPYQSLPEVQDWQRRGEPILSAALTKEAWSRVLLYMPCVLRADGIYKMWYVGTAEHARGSSYMHLGYATSEDGVRWEEWPDNPIAMDDEIPWGARFQCPFVLYDLQERIYKMWFTASHAEIEDVFLSQQVGYGESEDGIAWDFRAEPVLGSGRRPCVLEEEDGYRMWVNALSPTDPEVKATCNIAAARSANGIDWTVEGDAVRPGGIFHSCVYPFVLRDRDGWAMWYGGHHIRRNTGWFDIAFAESADGKGWECRDTAPVFPAHSDARVFDGRYTSTPHILSLPGKFAMYYSARDMDDMWQAPDGSWHRDLEGVYRHIGYAELAAEVREDPTLRFFWTLDGQRLEQRGNALALESLGAGTHEVSCRVENVNGATGYTWDLELV